MIAPQEIIERITSSAEYHDCVVVVEFSTQANLRWASNTLTTNGVIETQNVTVIAFVEVNGGMATASLTFSDLQESELSTLAKQVGDLARAAGPSNDAFELMKNSTSGDWTKPHDPTGPEAFKDFSPALGNSLKAAQYEKIELFGYAEHNHRTVWVGSKGGLRLRHDQPAGRLEMTAKSHDRTRSTWEGRSTRDFKDIDLSQVDASIRTRLGWQATQLSLEAGRYKTIAPSGAVADLLAIMLWGADARRAAEGRSAFAEVGKPGSTRIGSSFSNTPLNIFSDHSYRGLECSPFGYATASSNYNSVFDNGVPHSKVDWFENGTLKNLISTRSIASQTGIPYAPGGDNIVMQIPGATGDLDSLIHSVDDGLLLTTLWYIREVDPITALYTGLTRDGVYKIKDGEVVGAVNNFRWNESPVNLLSRISGASATGITAPRELEEVERISTPALVFNGFNMSTVSKGN